MIGYKFRKLIKPRLEEHRESVDGQRVHDLKNWLKCKRKTQLDKAANTI